MAELEKVIKAFDEAKELVWTDDDEYTVGYNNGLEAGKNIALTLLKEQNKTVNTWRYLWDAPDGSFKARCGNCGFVHFFIQGHCSQYRFCPQCGEQKVI
ncbi:MAG: hypothetical protein IKS46_03420 [Clostridia bacterium]|nr:hypothetical protein [Clostridia bacterium]